MAQHHGVALIEEPVGGSSATATSRTGPLIRRALSYSTRWSTFDWNVLSQPHPRRVAIAYEDAWPAPGGWRLSQAETAAFDGVLLEPNVSDQHAYAKAATQLGMTLIPSVSALAPTATEMTADELDVGGGFIYLALGQQTGRIDVSLSDVALWHAKLKVLRPELPVFCAFGIRTAAQVVALRRLGCCDGVIIGSGALEALQRGTDHFEFWLASIMHAAEGPDTSFRPRRRT
jgi:tryptophan synthase alpha subunit